MTDLSGMDTAGKPRFFQSEPSDTRNVRLALQIKTLVEEVRQYDENAQKLSERLNTLRTIVQHAGTQYGQEEEYLYTISEQQMRQAIRRILSRCESDLQKFKKRLCVLVSRGNWASKAWTQQTAAPDLARIDKSLSDHQRDIGSLSSLLLEIRTGQIRDTQRQILELLRRLTNTPSDDIPPSITSGDTDANTNAVISRLTTLVGGPDPIDGQHGGDFDSTETFVGDQEPTGRPGPEYNDNGALLLEAILKGHQEEFTSLLHNYETSLRVVDEQDQTALLLAAHLGNKSMVEAIIACIDSSSADKPNQPPEHRTIDYHATDSLGRTVLHYCAEFGMHDEANMMLDHSVDINATDKSDHPPMYYAIKFRQYDAVKLLLDKGAARDLEWPPESTSHEIKMLFEEGSDSSESTTAPTSDQVS
ncbi:MAG: hypothetical protein Q9171_001045 [Xanthocarpia ochracea]